MKRKHMQFYSLLFLLLVLIIGITCEIIYLNRTNYSQEKRGKEGHQVNYHGHSDSIKSFNLAEKKLQVKNDKTPTLVFSSDYQGDNRYGSMNSILETNRKDIDPNLFVFCGDYQEGAADNFDNTEYGIIELYSLVNNYYKNSVPQLFIQGNHDSEKAYGISESGIYESEKYIVYVINEDEFPNDQNKSDSYEDIVKKTSLKVKEDLQSLVNKNIHKPIFIATHMPIHYSNRNNGGDNKYSKYMIDVLNEYGDSLDIIYLFGHNHSGRYDDYIGGSVNYIAKNSTLKEGGTNKEREINFTYLNAGYMSYSANALSDNVTNTPSISAITINDDNLSIQKYNKYGRYYAKPIIVKLENK